MRFLAGTYTNLGGPGVAALEAANGKLTYLDECRVVQNPNYLILSRDRTTVYAAASMGGGEKGAVASFRLNGTSLTPLCIQPAGGDDVCHIALSPDEDVLYSANYSSGSVSAFPVRDGYIFPREQLFRHRGGSGVVPDRQEAVHTHQCAFRPGTDEMFVCDLGRDEILIYTPDEETGLRMHTSTVRVSPGSGPRHLLFPSEDRFLLVSELSNQLTDYRRTEDGWTAVSTLSTLPPGCEKSDGAAAVRAFGDTVFVTNRGYDSVARFSSAGGIRLLDVIPIQGRFPRDVMPLSSSEFIAANQRSGTVEWVKDGRTVCELSVPGAVCLLPIGESRPIFPNFS